MTMTTALSNQALGITALAFALVLLIVSVAALVHMWRHPRIRAALAAGLALSLYAVVPWALMASLSIGPTGPLHLTVHDLPGSYLRLAEGPSGDLELAVIVLLFCMTCGAVAGARSARIQNRAAGAAAAETQDDGEPAGFPYDDDGGPGYGPRPLPGPGPYRTYDHPGSF